MSGFAKIWAHPRSAVHSDDERGRRRTPRGAECSDTHAAGAGIPTSARQSEQGADTYSAGRRRGSILRFTARGSMSAVCLAAVVCIFGPSRAVEAELQTSSMRAKSYMRFGGSSSAASAAFYENQVKKNGYNFFSVSSDFKVAAGLPTLPSEQKIASAIVKGASHMSFKDTDGILYNVGDKRVSLEAFVRIRDSRVLSPPAQPDNFPDTRIGGTHIKLPIMGNMMHRGESVYLGQGYQLACGYDKEPVCCAEAYTTATQANKPSKPSVSACVSIAPLLATAGPGAPAGQTGWFHISGFFESGQVTVMVNESSAYYSQSQYSAFKQQGVDSVSDSIQVYGKEDKSDPPTAFRLASSMPFAAAGDVIDKITNYQYLFLRVDIDEVKIWVKPKSAPHPVRNQPKNFLDWFEGVDTCPMQGFGGPNDLGLADLGLVLYIQERRDGNAINSSVTFPQSDMATSDVSGTNQPELNSEGFLAVGVDNTLNAEFRTPCNDENYKHFGACGQTYIDRRAEAVSSLLSTNVELDTKFQYEDYRDGREGLSDRVDLWEFSPDKGVGSARIVFVDRNFNDDKLTIIKPFSTSTTFVFLDYNFDVEQFTSGLPFYNIAKDTNLESFRNLGRGISPDATYPKWDKQVWNAKFTPNANDNANCLEGYSNCQGIIINFNLTLPDPWLGAGGLGWQAICPLAFDKGIEGGKGIDPQYRFLCTEWWVPYGRGWPIQTKFKETLSCTASTSSVETTYRAKIGYEARPEWYSVAEAPTKQAANAGNAGTGSDANCPAPDTVIWTQVGKPVESSFRARDRNKDDAVDILPADDPGLPNGAKLFPALPARARNVTLSDTTRPRLYERLFTFTPTPSQVNSEYRVCMKARSYRHEETPLQFAVDSQQAYERQLGETIQTMPYQTCDPGSGSCPPTMWVDRCIFVNVAPPEMEFGCSPDLDTSCIDDDYLPGKRLGAEATLEFTAGDTVCSDVIELEARDVWKCPQNTGCPGKYDVDIYLDREMSDVPEGFKLLPEGKTAHKTVSWTPSPGKDERLEGYQACFVASDYYGISKVTRCYTVRVRKCKYCLQADETLADVGRRFQVDWLQIYMANPHIPTPDNVPRSLATVNTGVFYDVRAGDYLELLGQRFFMTESQLRLLNPDVPKDGHLQPGQNLCIMPPVCSVKCLYGTDCHIY